MGYRFDGETAFAIVRFQWAARDKEQQMSAGTVFAAGWTLEDVDWSKFDATKVDAALLATVKGASLVEYNADEYVSYLTRVFKDAFARFRAGYRPPHFESDSVTSVRGSRRGEMVARCVVESGTSSFYSAMRDAADEPVLKEIAGRIAADEFRHYRLFYETLQAQDEPALPWWRRLFVAATRVNESSDDELAYAYYCGNVPARDVSEIPY